MTQKEAIALVTRTNVAVVLKIDVFASLLGGRGKAWTELDKHVLKMMGPKEAALLINRTVKACKLEMDVMRAEKKAEEKTKQFKLAEKRKQLTASLNLNTIKLHSNQQTFNEASEKAIKANKRVTELTIERAAIEKELSELDANGIWG